MLSNHCAHLTAYVAGAPPAAAGANRWAESTSLAITYTRRQIEKMDIESAIKCALDGDAVLFVGAGFSADALSIEGHKLKSSKQLAQYFGKMCGLEEGVSLEDASDEFSKKFGVDELIREIQRGYTVRETMGWHRDIAKVRWKRIYTTNYDTVVEESYKEEGRLLRTVTLSDRLPSVPKDETICVHLNGVVSRINRQNIFNELKLTDTSYISANIAQSDWSMLFRQDIRLARAVFFIGYSLFDLDIKRIVYESDPLREKCFFVLGDKPIPETLRTAERFGSVVLETGEAFSLNMNRILEDYEPRSPDDYSLCAISECVVPGEMGRITDKSFLDLMLLGDRSIDLVANSISTGSRYYLERNGSKLVFDLIDGGNRAIVIRGDFGNGKSLLLDGLLVRAIERGFRAFFISEDSEDVEKELETVACLKEPLILCIEDYQDWLDEIRVFNTLSGSNAILVLTARNAVHDTYVDELENILGLAEICEIPVDKLGDDEIEWFSNAYDEYGLWGELAGERKGRKITYLRRDCHAEIHAILLKLLNSPHIKQKLNSISAALKSGSPRYNMLIGAMILALINQRPTVGVLADIWGTELTGTTVFKNDKVISEVVDFGRDVIRLRSPIAAKYFLNEVINANAIVQILITMTKRAWIGGRLSRQYRRLFKTLMRFNSLQMILPEKGRGQAVIKFYEAVRDTPGCKDNPLFWLQYAIASLVGGDRERAKRYFDTSYSIALDREWDTFQIDNHYARLLLETSIKDLESADAMENFREARRILIRQMENERLHYPYKVAISFQDFWDRHHASLADAELKEILAAAEDINNRIGELPRERKKHRYVENCVKALNYVLSKRE